MSPEQPRAHEPGGPDEVARRFEEMMRREFTSTPSSVEDEPFSLEAALREAIPDPVEDEASYRDVEVLKNSWAFTSLVGFVLMVGGLANGLVMLFGVRLSPPWPQVSALAAIAGVAILLVKALRARPREDDSDHGARV